MAAAPDDTRWGTIFMGPTPDRESTIDKVTEDRQRELWNRRTEAEYMERVRAKATVRVQAMLDQARVQAEAIRGTARQWAEKLKAECEALHEQARKTREDAEALLAQAARERAAGWEEGYKAGAEQAVQDLNVHRIALEDATASVLKTIEEQGSVLFGAWRQDLAVLTRDCVECLTGWVLTEERNAVLEGLLAAAVRELAERRRLELHVNPADCEAVTLVIESAKARFPDVKHWEVRADETIEQGGLIVESASGMVDNRPEIRRQAVDDILRRLVLPAGPADAEALATVARQMENSGINALAAQSEERAAQAAAEEAAAAAELAEEAAETAAASDQDLGGDVSGQDASGSDISEPEDAESHLSDLSDLQDQADVSAQTGEGAETPALPPAPADTAVQDDVVPDATVQGDAVPPDAADQPVQEDEIPVLDIHVADAATEGAPQPETEQLSETGERAGANPVSPDNLDNPGEVTAHGA